MELYLNGGYSKPGQYYLRVKSHPRLINRLADGLLTLHPIGPYTHNGNETGGLAKQIFQHGQCLLPALFDALYNPNFAARHD